jgi:hypothetical protein
MVQKHGNDLALEAHPDRPGIEGRLDGEADTERLDHDRQVTRRQRRFLAHRPADRMPGWLAAIHSVLPIQAMGEVMRGTITSNSFPLTWGAFLLLGTWCVASFATTSLVLTRRA